MPLIELLRRLLRLAVLPMLLAAAAPAHALCLSPLCSCTSSASTLLFGVHNPLAGTATEGTANVTLRCTGLAGVLIPYELALDGGGSGIVGARRMTSGGAQLPYELFRNPGRTLPWGNSSGTGLVLGGVLLELLGVAVTHTHTVYGRIPAGPVTAVPGSYSDTLTVTLTYF